MQVGKDTNGWRKEKELLVCSGAWLLYPAALVHMERTQGADEKYVGNSDTDERSPEERHVSKQNVNRTSFNFEFFALFCRILSLL